MCDGIRHICESDCTIVVCKMICNIKDCNWHHNMIRPVCEIRYVWGTGHESESYIHDTKIKEPYWARSHIPHIHIFYYLIKSIWRKKTKQVQRALIHRKSQWNINFICFSSWYIVGSHAKNQLNVWKCWDKNLENC